MYPTFRLHHGIGIFAELSQTKPISLLQGKKKKEKRGLIKHPLHLYKLFLIFSLKKS